MNIVQKQINLNVRNPNNYQIIHAMQGDNDTMEIEATIWDGNDKYTINCDTISIDCISPSGIQNQLKVLKHSTNTVTFHLDKNVLGENGEHKLSVHFMSEPNISLTTFPACLYVSNAPLGSFPKGVFAIITEYVYESKKNAELAREYYNKLLAEKGQPNGIATLDGNAKTPVNELYEATTTTKGITQLTDSITSTSTTTAATPNSVKTVNNALQEEIERATKAENNLDTQLNAKAPLASPDLTGTPKAPTAATGTNTTQIATTAFVQTAVSEGIAASDALIFKGSLGANGTVTTLPTTYKTGWTYRVVTAGTYAGQTCEIGDLVVALVDRSGTGNVDADWCVAQTNIDGAITGIKSGDAYITVSQSGSIITITHKDVTRDNITSTASPASGGTFTAVKSVTSDSKGHVTGVDTETITLPSTSVTVDSALSSTSTNPVQNKVINNALANYSKTSVTAYGARFRIGFNNNITVPGWVRFTTGISYGQNLMIKIGKGFNTCGTDSFIVSICTGYNSIPTITQLGSRLVGGTITKVRCVYTAETIYVEFYAAKDISKETLTFDIWGHDGISISNGSVPSGYSSTEITLKSSPIASNMTTTVDTATTATEVIDYADTTHQQKIKIGLANNGLTPDQAKYIAAYGRDSNNNPIIKDLSFDNLKTKLGLNSSLPDNGDICIKSGSLFRTTSSSTLGLKYTYFTNPFLQILPSADNKVNLGHNEYRLGEIRSVTMYVGSGTAVTSDQRLKNTINPLDEEKTYNFVMKWQPKSFKYNDGQSDRLHYGFIAQDIEAAMKELSISSQDFAGLVIDSITKPVEEKIMDENGNATIQQRLVPTGKVQYNLRYEEFISPLTMVVQKQDKEIKKLYAIIEELVTKIDSLQ